MDQSQCIQPAITVRRILQMIIFEQHNCRHQRFFPLRRLGKMRFPVAEDTSRISIISHSSLTGNMLDSSRITWYSCCLKVQPPSEYQLPSLRILFLAALPRSWHEPTPESVPPCSSPRSLPDEPVDEEVLLSSRVTLHMPDR